MLESQIFHGDLEAAAIFHILTLLAMGEFPSEFYETEKDEPLQYFIDKEKADTALFTNNYVASFNLKSSNGSPIADSVTISVFCLLCCFNTTS